jgi:putative transferase (TIGR04331 family)
MVNNDFEKFIISILPHQLPVSFMEGYDQLRIHMNSLGLSKAPAVFFTSNALWYNTGVMAYAATTVESGCRLVYGQHGGYGIPKFMRAEDHEIAISDRWLTWGWSDNSGKTFPVGLIKKGQLKRSPSRNATKLLLVRGLWGRYHFRLDSGSGLDLKDAIQDSIRFAKALPEAIRMNNLLLRLYHHDYGYGEKNIWRTLCPEVSLAKDRESMKNLVKMARLIVYTYNVGTGWIEFMAAGLPVIMFWDMKASPIREPVEPFFDEFRRAGIFHDNPESAAAHVSAVWRDVESWWDSDTVKNARNSFVYNYANVDTDVVREIKKHLLEVAEHSIQ